MKVVFVTRGALPRTGGIQAHQQTIAATLASGGHRVTVCSARIDDAPYDRINTSLGAQRFAPIRSNGVETIPFPLDAGRRARLLPVALGALPGVDRVFGYHRLRERTLPFVVKALATPFSEAFVGAAIIHAMGGEAQAHAALKAARLLGIPFVITPFAHPGFWGDDELNLRLYREADAVVALLAGERSWLVENGVHEDRVHVIGVPAPKPYPDPLDVVRAGAGHMPVGWTGPLVLFLGVKRRYKYKLLLDAMPVLRDPSLRVAFIGPETDEWEYDSDSLSKKDSERIFDAPKVDEREKWGWLKACDLLCLPSVSEIMPVSILEAWRMERPVVVARGRWTSDLVDDGENGIITDPRPEALAGAIEQVLAEPGRARRMGEAGRAKVEERYTAAVVSAAHERLYESLVGAKG